jgi:SAM-dependent methyltransferase
MPEQKGADVYAMSDLCTPWCIHTAATLNIAEHISAGIDEIEDLAAAAGCDAYALHRMLTYLVEHGIFEEPSPGRFQLNEAARRLLDPVLKMSLNLDGLGSRFANIWSGLLDYTRTGVSPYPAIFGLPFWEDLDAHPKMAANFDEIIGPAGHGKPNPDFQISGGWESIKTVVDVGGGTGAMLAEILRLRPHVRGILVDQPKTVSRSDKIFQVAGVEERVMTVGQSFFDPLPTGADLYLLRGIINDWPDQETAAILSRCAEAARPNGRVVVLKSISPDGAPRRLEIEMLLIGGKQRSVSEFRELARGAGLEIIASGQQPAYFVVECRPGNI